MSIERYSRATQSKNLSYSDWRTLDVDWLAAAGMAAIHGNTLGPRVARWLTGSKGAMFSVLDAMQKTYARHRTLDNDARDDIVEAADWWHNHTCQDCGGRGHRQIPDTPMQEEMPCVTCFGTGVRAHSRSTYAYGWTLRELEAAAAICALAISEKVA